MNKIIERKKWNIKVALLVVIAFLWIFQNIPYSRKWKILLVVVFFWNIPGIFHIPEKLKIIMLSDFSGIFHFVKFNIPWNIPWDIPKKIWTLFYGGVKFNQEKTGKSEKY